MPRILIYCQNAATNSPDGLLSGCRLKCEKIQKYQVLKCRLKREKLKFPGLNSQIFNRASCIEFDFVPLWQKLWKVAASIHHLRSGADLNGCRLYKLIFRFGACADLSGCRLKCEKNMKMKTGGADLRAHSESS